MIRPFADHDTEAPFRTEGNRRCLAIARVAYRLSLDFVWTRRSGNHRLPSKLNHNAMRCSHESPRITPGEILLQEYLKPMRISPNAMVRAIGVPPRAVNEVVPGKRAITPSMSIRFGAFSGPTPEFWHRLQADFEFRALAGKQKKRTATIRSATEVFKVA